MYFVICKRFLSDSWSAISTVFDTLSDAAAYVEKATRTNENGRVYAVIEGVSLIPKRGETPEPLAQRDTLSIIAAHNNRIKG